MKLMPLLCLVIVMFAACSHKSVKDPSAPRSAMFPNGSYQHEVNLQIAAENGQKKQFHFSGAVEIKDDRLSLAAFSPFGTTLFRITDDRLNKPDSIKTEIYADQIKPHEQKMRQFYSVIRTILTLPYAGERSRDLQTPSGPAKITFENVDAHGIPDQITVASTNFNLQIKVVGYDL